MPPRRHTLRLLQISDLSDEAARTLPWHDHVQGLLSCFWNCRSSLGQSREQDSRKHDD